MTPAILKQSPTTEIDPFFELWGSEDTDVLRCPHCNKPMEYGEETCCVDCQEEADNGDSDVFDPETATDQEITDWLTQRGEDPQEVAARTRALFERVLREHTRGGDQP